MFTGIVEDVGRIKKISRRDANITFEIASGLTDIGVDDSIACNGICLTVEQIAADLLTFTAVSETIQKTTAGNWVVNEHVNLERTLKFNGRIDGHLVQGHVDGTAVCTSIQKAGGSHEFTFLYDRKFSSLLIEKGSICINGVSLTAFQVDDDTFKVAIIPYTYANTNFQYLRENESVNLEFDMVGKYIQRFLTLQNQTTQK